MCADQPDPISAVATLDEPTRRRLYEYVARAPVRTNEVSAAVDISRPTAAFHLDRLVDQRLLDVVHQRLPGRTAPGAGRPSKLYLRSGLQVEVSLPQRRYEHARELLAAAVEEAEAAASPIRDAGVSRLRAARGGGCGRVGQLSVPQPARQHIELTIPRSKTTLVPSTGNCCVVLEPS